jgi:hypothetical protein
MTERSVAVAQEDKRWLFIANGQPLAQEDLQGYTAHRKRDRLNEEKIAALLSRLEATPWLEEFYALPESQAFVLRRKNPPAALIRCSVGDVLRRGQAEGAAHRSQVISPMATPV